MKIRRTRCPTKTPIAPQRRFPKMHLASGRSSDHLHFWNLEMGSFKRHIGVSDRSTKTLHFENKRTFYTKKSKDFVL